MKFIRVTAFFMLMASAIYSGCGRLDEQAPQLIVTIDTTNFTGTVDDTRRIYLVFFMDNAWLTQLYSYGSLGTTFMLPNVPLKSAYIAAYYDIDASGTLNTGDPAMGYASIAPKNQLTLVPFFALKLTRITIPLDDAVTYP